MGGLGSDEEKEEVVNVLLSEEEGNLGAFFDNLFLSWVKFLRRGNEKEVEDWYSGGGGSILSEVVVLGCFDSGLWVIVVLSEDSLVSEH